MLYAETTLKRQPLPRAPPPEPRARAREARRARHPHPAAFAAGVTGVGLPRARTPQARERRPAAPSEKALPSRKLRVCSLRRRQTQPPLLLLLAWTPQPRVLLSPSVATACTVRDLCFFVLQMWLIRCWALPLLVTAGLNNEKKISSSSLSPCSHQMVWFYRCRCR